MASEDNNDFDMQPVTGSSQIAAAGYQQETQKLRIEFSSGALYEYDNVPLHVYGELMSAASVGSYFHSSIKQGGYGYTRLN